MLDKNLLTVISGLQEDYLSLYKSLSEMDEYLSDEDKAKEIHQVLREKLLTKLNEVAVGTPMAKAIHRALRGLTRLHPFNTQCPLTLEDIDLRDTDSYFAFSNGFIVSKTPEFIANLRCDSRLWIYPSSGEALSAHDVDYVENLCNIKKPAEILGVASTPMGVVTVFAGGSLAYMRGGENVRLNVIETMITLTGIHAGEILIFRTIDDLRAAQRARQESAVTIQPDTELVQEPAPNPLSSSVVVIEDTRPIDQQMQPDMPAETRRPFLQRFFGSSVRPEDAQPRAVNRSGCCVIS